MLGQLTKSTIAKGYHLIRQFPEGKKLGHVNTLKTILNLNASLDALTRHVAAGTRRDANYVSRAWHCNPYPEVVQAFAAHNLGVVHIQRDPRDVLIAVAYFVERGDWLPERRPEWETLPHGMEPNLSPPI